MLLAHVILGLVAEVIEPPRQPDWTGKQDRDK
jgi:hypothetical protein